MTTPDPFALHFDAIDLDPARAPAREAIERALASLAPASDAPGFYLIDDAGGRFQIDRDTGVVSLLDDTLLTSEFNSVHSVRLRVIEHSGTSYELDLKLRLTGHVPRAVGAEDFFDALTTPEPAASEPARAPEPARAATPWSAFSATVCGAAPATLGDAAARYGAVLAPPPPPSARGPFQLRLYTPLPAPSPPDAVWSP